MFNTRDALKDFFIELEPYTDAKGLAAAFVVGIVLTLKHPEYSQAFFKALMEQRPEAGNSYSQLANSFIRENPIEMELEV